MKIIYSRKQAQQVVEYVNTNANFLTKPLSLREVCEGVVKAFVDSYENVQNGVVYTFRTYGEDSLYCIITTQFEYYADFSNAGLFEVEVTEDMLQEQSNKQLERFKEKFGEVDIRFIEDLEGFIEQLEEELEDSEINTVLENLEQQSDGKVH